MNRDIFDDFAWHSSIGIDASIAGNSRFVTRIPNTKKARGQFIVASGDNFLIHKTTKALWKVSEDKRSIEPLFPTDVLTAEQLEEITEEQQ